MTEIIHSKIIGVTFGSRSSSSVSAMTLLTAFRIFSLEMVHCYDHCNQLEFTTYLYRFFCGGYACLFIWHIKSV